MTAGLMLLSFHTCELLEKVLEGGGTQGRTLVVLIGVPRAPSVGLDWFTPTLVLCVTSSGSCGRSAASVVFLRRVFLFS